MSDVDGTAAQPPRTILITWAALITAAAFAVLTALTLFAARTWLEQQSHDTISKKAITSSYTEAQKAHDLLPSQISRSISAFITSQLVISLVTAVLLVFIAIRVRSGAHWTRWVVVGLWVLSSVFGFSLIGALPALSVIGKFPVLTKIPCLIGALAFLTAVVAVNLPPSTAFINANKPVRADTAGAPAPGLRGLFAPRPSAPKPPPQPAPAKSATTEAPAKLAKPDAQRTKAKARTSAPVNPPAKSRGKSRGR